MTAERYTAVLTGLLAGKKPGEYLYLTMGEDSYTAHHGTPPRERIGHEVTFSDFPEGCRRLVLDIYREAWDL